MVEWETFSRFEQGYIFGLFCFVGFVISLGIGFLVQWITGSSEIGFVVGIAVLVIYCIYIITYFYRCFTKDERKIREYINRELNKK